MEGLRLVAHERLGPRRVDVYAASGDADKPLGDDFSRGDEDGFERGVGQPGRVVRCLPFAWSRVRRDGLAATTPRL